MPPMPEHDADQPPVRPEVVQAIFSALTDMDPGKLAPLEVAGIGITPAEQRQANLLYAASIEASFDQRERFARAMEVLIGGRKFSKPPGWAELFDGLSPEGTSELRELYDALPGPARAEYDRRYRRPGEI
jgi:hypothetical protein